MRVLLDTHALLWWFDGDRRLPKRMQALIADEGNEILVSAASAWEIATKARLGKLPQALAIAGKLKAAVAEQGSPAIPGRDCSTRINARMTRAISAMSSIL